MTIATAGAPNAVTITATGMTGMLGMTALAIVTMAGVDDAVSVSAGAVALF